MIEIAGGILLAIGAIFFAVIAIANTRLFFGLGCAAFLIFLIVRQLAL